jgi:hypothetical protein
VLVVLVVLHQLMHSVLMVRHQYLTQLRLRLAVVVEKVVVLDHCLAD